MVAAPSVLEQTWTSDSSQFLAIEYDDTYLVYFKPSGDTHFLNFLSFGLVESVSKTALSGVDLHKKMMADFSLTPLELTDALVISTIEELDQAGLMSRVDTKT